MEHIPDEAAFFKMANQSYQDWAVAKGFFDAPQPCIFNLYLEPLRKFQLAAEGHGDVQPPEHLRQRVLDCFTPLPSWYPPFEGEGIDVADYPYHAITQRPAAMYHSWGSQNAWLRQIHGENPLYVPGPICDEVGLVDGDWAWVSSYHGRICVPIKRMNAVNGKTLWTWKFGGEWQIVDSLRFRVMQQRAIRVPTAAELFQDSADAGFFSREVWFGPREGVGRVRLRGFFRAHEVGKRGR